MTTPKFKVGDRIALAKVDRTVFTVTKVTECSYEMQGPQRPFQSSYFDHDIREIDNAYELVDGDNSDAILKRLDDDHILVCQAVTLLNNGETHNASILLREWLNGWRDPRDTIQGTGG